MNISIIYHSESGNTKKIAESVWEGIKEAGDITIKLMSIDDVDASFVEKSSAVIFGSPTYSASVSWQMKRFFDTTKLPLAGKLGGVFATEGYIGGGADVCELVMIGAMLVQSMVVYSGGAFCGEPLTHYGAVAIQSGDEVQIERAKVYGTRMAQKALELSI